MFSRRNSTQICDKSHLSARNHQLCSKNLTARRRFDSSAFYPIHDCELTLFKKCILHIGTEKTGPHSLSKVFLFRNQWAATNILILLVTS